MSEIDLGPYRGEITIHALPSQQFLDAYLFAEALSKKMNCKVILKHNDTDHIINP
jgi:hypothetical protein